MKSKVAVVTFLLLANHITAQDNLAKVFIECAHEALAKGDYAKAIDQYSTMIEINPLDTEMYFNRAILESEYGNYTAAISDYSKAISFDSVEVDYYFLRGISYNATQNYVAAAKDFTLASKMEPNNADLHYHYGVALLGIKKYHEGIAEFNKAIQMKSEMMYEIYLNLFYAHMALKKTNEAYSFLKSAVQYNEEKTTASFEMVKLCLDLNKIPEVVSNAFLFAKNNQDAVLDVQAITVKPNQEALLQKEILSVITNNEISDSTDTDLLLVSKVYALLNMNSEAEKLLSKLGNDANSAFENNYIQSATLLKYGKAAEALTLLESMTSDVPKYYYLEYLTLKKLQKENESCDAFLKYRKKIAKYAGVEVCK